MFVKGMGEEPDHRGWKSLPLHLQTQLVSSDSPKSSTVQLSVSVCWGNCPVSAKSKHVTVLVLHQGFIVILGLTSYVLTCYLY